MSMRIQIFIVDLGFPMEQTASVELDLPSSPPALPCSMLERERYEDRNCAVAGPVKRPTPPAAARSWQRMYASRCPAGLHGVWVRGETYRVTRARDLCVSTRKEKKQN